MEAVPTDLLQNEHRLAEAFIIYMRFAPCVNEVGNHHQRDNEKTCQIQKTKLHTTTPL